MTIPNKIKIAGLDYEVIIVDELDVSGRTDHDAQTIKLLKTKGERMYQTFFHEIMHCINNELNEIDTEFYGIALYQFLKENNIT